MDKLTDPMMARREPNGRDDMEQVRQLILGDHAARQAQRIEDLEYRLEKVEQLLRAIVSHSESSQRTWEVEVASLFDDTSATNFAHRGVAGDVTSLSPDRSDHD